MVTIQASAPGRCGIVGNPSDIYGGAVLSCSIPCRNSCRIEIGATPIELPDSRLWDAAHKRLPIGPCRVTLETDVPRSSGLSGSTAMIAAMTAGLLAIRGELPDLTSGVGRTAFAELVRDIERNDASIVCGFQDAYMISHGGLQLMEFPGKHPINPAPSGTLTEIDAETPFLLITTGVERLSGAVHGQMIDRWLSGDTAVIETMNCLPPLARQGAVAMIGGDWDLLAELMRENQERVAAIGGSGEPIDRLIKHCLDNGARSAKLAGAGLGGTVIALCDDRLDLERRLRAVGYVRFVVPEKTIGAKVEELAGRKSLD